MTTTIDKNSSDNTELQSLLGKICCMGNVDNIGSPIGTHQIDPKIKYSNPIGY